MKKLNIEEIKNNYPNAKIKYISSYGENLTYNNELHFLAAKYNPKTNELIFMADARKIKN